MKILINIISWIAFPVALGWSFATKFDYEPLLALLASIVGILGTFNGGNQTTIRGRVRHNTQTNITYVKQALNIIPFSQYIVSILLIAIVISIIAAMKLESFKFNYIGFGSTFAFGILIFLASKITTSTDATIKFLGRFLYAAITILFVASSTFVVSSVFFDWPKRYCEYFGNCEEDIGFVMPQIDTCKVHILVSDYIDENGRNGHLGKVIALEIESKLENLIDSFPRVRNYVNPITIVHEMVNSNNYISILKKYNADIILYGTYVNPIEGTSKFYTNILMDAALRQEYRRASNIEFKQKDIFSLDLSQLIGEESKKVIYYFIGSIISGLEKCTLKELRDYKLASDLLKKAYEIETNRDFDISAASEYFFVLQDMGNLSEAADIYINLLNHKLLSATDRALVYLDLGDIYSRTGEFSIARKNIEQSLLYYKMQEDTAGIVRSYNMLGAMFIHMQLQDSVKLYYTNAIKYKNYADPNTLAKITNGMGFVYSYDKKYKEAIAWFIEGNKLYKKVDDLLGEVVSLENISQAYGRMDSIEKAIDYSLQALKIAESATFKEDCAMLYWQLSFYYREKKKYEIELAYLKKCYDLIEEVGLIDRLPITQYRIAMSFNDLMQKDSCRRYLTLCISSAKRYDDPETLGLAKSQLTKLGK